jgi:predicted ATP-grasp superfamily ATP-dependent carboligase
MTGGLRVLMSEGSSLSARESLTALGRAGCSVEVVDGNPLCLARFSRYAQKIHPGPRFGAQPRAYLDLVIRLLKTGRFDVLFPAHEQALLFARYQEQLSALARLALPRFEDLDTLQSKVRLARVLRELWLPGPRSAEVFTADELRDACTSFPVYLKAAYGTASSGLRLVERPAQLPQAIADLSEALRYGVVVQAVVEGHLERAQAVFDHGELLAFHACRQIAAGVSGGDLAKESVSRPAVRLDLEKLGKHLAWHGGLSMDFIVQPEGGHVFIDANPRLAEVGNALAAGLNLPELLVLVSLGAAGRPLAEAAPGVRSVMGLQGLLRSASQAQRREDVARTLLQLLRSRGVFASVEELLPVREDPRAAIPLSVVAASLLVSPRSWRRFSSGAVEASAATLAVVDLVQA